MQISTAKYYSSLQEEKLEVTNLKEEITRLRRSKDQVHISSYSLLSIICLKSAVIWNMQQEIDAVCVQKEVDRKRETTTISVLVDPLLMC